MCKYVKILIDDLSISWKYDIVSSLISTLRLNPSEGVPMRTKHYTDGLYFSGILIAWNTDVLGLISDTFLDISGKGCRYLEQLHDLQFDWFNFLNSYDSDLLNSQAHISRIDIALDLEDEEIPYAVFQKYALNELYVCRSKLLPKVVMMREENIYFGSEHSDRLLRIYNKALEQGLPGTYWIRLEFQLRNACAMSWYLNWRQRSDRDIGYLFRGVLADYLRFVTPPKGMKTSIEEIKRNRNQRILPTAPWWDKLLASAERIPQLYLPGEEYTISKLEHYLKKQTYSSIKAYAIAHDGDLTQLIDGVSHAKLNTKQKQMLEKLELMRSEIKHESTESV